MADDRGILKSADYEKDYYEEHVAVGLDFLVYGTWHSEYAAMVANATLQSTYDSPFVIDAGCACGAQLMGFKDTGIFSRVAGVDYSSAMIEKGRSHFGLDAEQLICGSIAELPFNDCSATLINSGQVLEHIDDKTIGAAFAEFHRVLMPGGRMFHNWAALKFGDPLDIHDGDPTHVNVKPTVYWMKKFIEAGFLPDFESYDRFVRSSHVPGGGYPNFYTTYEIWTSAAWIKPA